jgi:hypothetical protein
MKKALISPLENNRVCEITSAEFPVAEPLFWVDCPDEVEAEWVYVDGQFVAPVTPEYIPLPEPTKAELLAQLQALTSKIEAL